jgi:prepilin-type N-terminal cleavage/methylation domain-containing protein
MKKAFTLIELLVVIAIIAILAAILFPVFAQAKEAAKKTATLTHYKQTGTASAIYLTDYDDLYPMSFAYNTAGFLWRAGSYHATPKDSNTAANRHLEPRRTEEEVYVINAMNPYMKNFGMLEAAGLPLVTVGTANPTGPKPAPINVSFNGMLHAYSGTAIAQVAKLPMFWGGMMKQNLTGMSLSQPQLDCPTAGTAAAAPPCMFNPGSGPQGGQPAYGYAWYLVGSAGNFSAWLYSKAMPVIYADTHAKMQIWNAPNWPTVARNVDVNPFSAMDPAGPPGSPYWMTDCVAPGAAAGTMTYYPGFFRPDSEFSYDASNSCAYS